MHQRWAPAREEYKKYDLTISPCFWLASHSDWSNLFAISSSHLFAVTFSVSQVGLKKANNYTWMWEILLQGHILSTSGDTLKHLFVQYKRIVACSFSHLKLAKKSMFNIGVLPWSIEAYESHCYKVWEPVYRLHHKRRWSFRSLMPPLLT